MNWNLVFVAVAYLLTTMTTETLTENNFTKIMENVCNATVKYLVKSEKESNYTYTEKYNSWCRTFPFRCTKNRVKSRIEVKTILEFKNKTIYTCCEGYRNVSGRCVPFCEDGCGNGKCLTPSNCSCFAGWKGLNCSEECEEGQYGKGCIEKCLCENGATCDKINGICHCISGFTGEYCETPCSGPSSGDKCENVCKCKNGAICNETDRSCNCLPGYFGEYCNSKCPNGSFGKDCKNTCKCKKVTTDVCNHINGECLCVPGWRGEYCDKTCADNTWGFLCNNTCDCGPKSSCNRVTGKCSCASGWHGLKCEQKCPTGYFEKDCKMKCPDCLHKPGTCHHETGWCNCPEGSTGPTCDLECPEGKYGRNCDDICLCVSNSACNPVTGKCLCLPGWMGTECQFPCPEGTYGDYCNFTCNCPDKYSCNRFNGNCNCDETDDDPQCLKGMLEESVGVSSIWPAVLILAFITIVITLILIAIVIKILKRIRHYDGKILSNDCLSNADRGRNPSSFDGTEFENAAYETMTFPPTSVAQIQPIADPKPDTTISEVDFKIPDCDIAKLWSVKSHEKPTSENNSDSSKENILNRISVDSPCVRYWKIEINSTGVENPFQKSSVYDDIDLKEERN